MTQQQFNMKQQQIVAVSEKSQVGEARRAAASISSLAGLNESDAGRVAIIVTELATNLAHYGKNGKMLFRADRDANNSGIVEILAIDSGPGFNSQRGMTDGYSTGGTPGNGLGAVRRIATTFDIYSLETAGTVIAALVAAPSPSKSSPDGVTWSCLSLPAPGEVACGDSWHVARKDGVTSLMIADGLGHGPEAASASQLAIQIAERDGTTNPKAFIEATHQAMVGTRGAAVAMASLDTVHNVLHYGGVGNVAASLFSDAPRRGLPSQNGIVGSKIPRVSVYECPISRSGLLVMFSDGLQSRWTFDNYSGLVRRHPAVIAGVLYRDFYRDRDDVTVLVGAWRGGTQ